MFVFLALLVTACLTSRSQTKLSGTVRDSEGNNIQGVSIVQKGTTNGTTTDLVGHFAISVNSTETVLVFTFVGMKPVEVAINGRSLIDVIMQPENVGLSDVVVTALGMQRDKKTLSFASQKVSGEELTKTATGNFMESLSGKVAGIDIRVSNSGAGGSTKVVLRGNKSIGGLSEPLYVIDGIPMVNNKIGQPGSYGGTDGGDGLSQLNPDDIESINILKGANSSALYGSQGANGVILITTKKGDVQKATVTITSGLTFENISGLPDFQYEYGAANGSDYSWSKTKGKYQRDYIKDFFQTGFIAKNSISISGGNDKTTAYFSYANTTANGVIPTNKYNKNNLSFNQSTKLFENKVSVSSNVMVTDERSVNRPGAGYYNNPLTGLYLFPRERDFASYKENYQVLDKDRNIYKMNWFSTEEKENNPFWELYKNSKTSQTTRAIVNTKLSWDISGHLKLEARGSADFAEKVYENKYYAGSNQVSVSMNGKWQYQKFTDKSIYGDAILSYNNAFGNVKVSGILGGSYQHNIFYDGIAVDNGSSLLMYPNLFSFLNIPYNVPVNPTINKSIKQGVFGNVQLGYKDLLFLDLSGRNDWASTLALTGNESYFYPSVGLSVLVSQMVKLPSVISFAKIRGSWSKTANEVPFDVVEPWNTISGTGGPDGPAGINQSTQMPFANLKPEIITANELGTEMKFFNNRLGFDFSLYNNVSTNQFLALGAPSGSGYTYYFVNAGKITNKGVEITIDAEPLNTKKASWKTSLNFATNKNKIVELIASEPGYQTGGYDEGFISITKAGGSFNDLYVYQFARNDAGQIILDSNGVPTKAESPTKVGNANPDWSLGWNNRITYKNFYMSLLINGKFGGVAFSKTEAFLDAYGVSQRSADARDAGSMPINAIQGTTSITSIDPVVYYSSIGDRNRIMEPYVYSRTNVRLGQLVLGYDLDVAKLKLPVKKAAISMVGRNMFFFYKKAPFDPEQAMSTNNYMQSNEVFSLPSTRSYGFSLKVTF